MTEIKGQMGELRATVHITRKATGEVETFELVGGTTPEQHVAIMKQIHGASGAMVGQGSELINQ